MNTTKSTTPINGDIASAALLKAAQDLERAFDFGVFTPTDERIISKLATIPKEAFGNRMRAVFAAIAKVEGAAK